MAGLDLLDTFEKTTIGLVDTSFRYIATWYDIWMKPVDVLQRVARSIPTDNSEAEQDSTLAPPGTFAAMNLILAILMFRFVSFRGGTSTVDVDWLGQAKQVFEWTGSIGFVLWCGGILLILSWLGMLCWTSTCSGSALRRSFSVFALATAALPLISLSHFVGVFIAGDKGGYWGLMTATLGAGTWWNALAKEVRVQLFRDCGSNGKWALVSAIVIWAALFFGVVQVEKPNSVHLTSALEATKEWEPRISQHIMDVSTWDAIECDRSGNNAREEIDAAFPAWAEPGKHACALVNSAYIHSLWATVYLSHPSRTHAAVDQITLATLTTIRSELLPIRDYQGAPRVPVFGKNLLRLTTLYEELPDHRKVRRWRAQLKEAEPAFVSGLGIATLYKAEIEATLRALDELADLSERSNAEKARTETRN